MVSHTLLLSTGKVIKYTGSKLPDSYENQDFLLKWRLRLTFDSCYRPLCFAAVSFVTPLYILSATDNRIIRLFLAPRVKLHKR